MDSIIAIVFPDTAKDENGKQRFRSLAVTKNEVKATTYYHKDGYVTYVVDASTQGVSRFVLDKKWIEDELDKAQNTQSQKIPNGPLAVGIAHMIVMHARIIYAVYAGTGGAPMVAPSQPGGAGPSIDL